MTTREEIVSDVTQLVSNRFGGNWQTAYDYYRDAATGTVSIKSIERLMHDAGSRFLLTTWPVAKAIMEALDTNGDGVVEWAEFSAVLNPPKP